MSFEDDDFDEDARERIPGVSYGEIMLPMHDPLDCLWPSTLAMEIALRAERPKDICEAYGIGYEDWERIRANPVFVSELTKCVEDLRREGAAFRIRAQMQSLELLKDSWKMIKDPATPHNVRADLIKFTIRISGLDASKDQGILGKTGGPGGFVININLGT